MWNFQIKKKLLAWFPEIKSFNITIVTVGFKHFLEFANVYIFLDMRGQLRETFETQNTIS